jgi:hypothetical protein
VRIRSRVLAIVATTVALGAPAAVPVQAAGTTAPTLSVAPRQGGVLAEGAALDLDVAIQNHGTGAVTPGRLRISLAPAPIVGVSTLVDQVEHPSTVLQGDLVATTATPAVPAGQTVPVHVHLSRAVVDSVIGHQAGARVVGASLDHGSDSVLAYSAVTRIPKGFSSSVGFGTVVPVTAPAGTTGVVPAADLGPLTQVGGAWYTALDAAEADPLATVLLDPEVQASIRLAGSAAPGSATNFLERLGALPNEVVELPYADGDVTLQRAAGASHVLQPTSFAGGAVSTPVPAATPGPTTSPTASPTATPAPTPTKPLSDTDLLQWHPASGHVAWPVPGTVSPVDLRFLAASEYPLTLLSSADVSGAPKAAGSGPHVTAGRSSVLLADATASRLLATASDGSGVQQDSALAELIALLGTDAVTEEAGSVLALPARTGDRADLDQVLRTIAAQGWIHGTTLQALAAGRATKVTLRQHPVPEDLVAPAAAAIDAEADVRALGTAITSQAATLTGPQRLSLLGALSTSWRSSNTGYATATAEVTAQLKTFVRNVQIDRTSDINYVGGSGSLPVAVTNQLDQPVEVVLAGTASNGRLHIEGTQVVDIPARSGVKAKLPVKSISNGPVDVILTLQTKDGHVIGKPREVSITVNAGWEAVGAVVFVTAMLALFGTGVYRNVRRARRRMKAAK